MVTLAYKNNMMTNENSRSHNSLHDEYQSNGFVVLRGLFPQCMIDVALSEIDRLFADPDLLRADNLRTAPRQSLISEKVFDRLDPVIDLSPPLRELTEHVPLLEAVEAVFGEPALLFKDKAIIKPPGTFGYGVHQDYTYWQQMPVPPEFMLSALVAIDKASEKNGALQIYPGLHYQHLRPAETPSEIFNPSAGLIDESRLSDVQPQMINVKPGDVVLFSSLAPHCSGPNRSDKHRRSLFLSYSAARFGNVYDRYYELFYSYLRKDRVEEPDTPLAPNS